jgi:hypothetical protein
MNAPNVEGTSCPAEPVVAAVVADVEREPEAERSGAAESTVLDITAGWWSPPAAVTMDHPRGTRRRDSRHGSQGDLAEQGRCRMTLARHTSPPPSTRITRARAAQENHSAVQNARAAKTVASHAADAEDCDRLLAMLGLEAADGTSR